MIQFWTDLLHSCIQSDMLSFWKKIRDNAWKIHDFFKKICDTLNNSKCFLPSLCLRTSSIPPWETMKCLLQILQYACCLPESLAITQSNVLVYSALKFDPLLYRIRFFCWANPWRWFTFRHLCWVYQVIQPLGLFVPVLFGLHSSP